MLSFRKKLTNKGFTIVELLIVIVVIGILAALVVTTYNGVQQKARDTERKTDINALQGQMEAYQAENGKYPALADVNTAAFRTANMKGLDAGALQDPKWKNDIASCTTAGAVVLQDSATPANGCYGYSVTPASCDNTTTDCTAYKLVANLESGAGGTYQKDSLQ